MGKQMLVIVDDEVDLLAELKPLLERSGFEVALATDGEQALALACSDSPEGQETWTMQLLADKLVEFKVVERISDETVRQTLKKTSLSPGRRNAGASRK